VRWTFYLYGTTAPTASGPPHFEGFNITDLKSVLKEVAHLRIWLQFDGLIGLQTQVTGCSCELLLYALLQTVHQLMENRSVWQLPELYEILSEWLWNERWLGKRRLYTVLYCRGKIGTGNLKIDRSVTGVERRIHPVSRGEEKIFNCHWTEWQHKNTEKKLEQ